MMLLLFETFIWISGKLFDFKIVHLKKKMCCEFNSDLRYVARKFETAMAIHEMHMRLVLVENLMVFLVILHLLFFVCMYSHAHDNLIC